MGKAEHGRINATCLPSHVLQIFDNAAMAEAVACLEGLRMTIS